jgi:hypothetical protein
MVDSIVLDAQNRIFKTTIRGLERIKNADTQLFVAQLEKERKR